MLQAGSLLTLAVGQGWPAGAIYRKPGGMSRSEAIVWAWEHAEVQDPYKNLNKTCTEVQCADSIIAVMPITALDYCRSIILRNPEYSSVFIMRGTCGGPVRYAIVGSLNQTGRTPDSGMRISGKRSRARVTRSSRPGSDIKSQEHL